MTFLAKLLKKSNLSDLQDVMDNLGFLADAEAQISEFYRLCSGAMPEEADLWIHLADQELKHAGNARTMIARIAGNPGLFKPGMAFSTAAIRMFSLEMQRLVEEMHAGRVPGGRLLAIALEIEDSAVEVNYGRIVKTGDAIFNMLARQNDSESAEHKNALSGKMRATGG